jgi:hypothetical protein
MHMTICPPKVSKTIDKDVGHTLLGKLMFQKCVFVSATFGNESKMRHVFHDKFLKVSKAKSDG